MKKILFLGGLSSGGAEHQMVVVASLLKKEGYDVTYLSSDQSDFFEKDLKDAGVKLLRIDENKIISFLKLNIPRTTILLFRLLKKNKYDTVISFVSSSNFLNCFTSKWKSTRHNAITGIRNNRDDLFLSPREKFYTRFEKYATTKVSNSDAAKVRFAQLFPNIAPKLMTIYNIVDIPIISSSYVSKKDNKVHIIVPASYREVKNPMRLLEAVALLKQDQKNKLRIDWYGNIQAGPELYQQMLAFIETHHLEDVMALHDATKDIANRIKEADMVGLFSTSEGLPNSICEGMMLGKPIIMTRVSDYTVLVDASNGFLCDADNPASIKEGLCAAASLSTSELLEMGTHSKNKADSLFSKKTILEQWKKII